MVRALDLPEPRISSLFDDEVSSEWALVVNRAVIKIYNENSANCEIYGGRSPIFVSSSLICWTRTWARQNAGRAA